MIKLMIVGRRAPFRSRRAGHAHLRNVHGPMVVAPPADAGAMPSRYIQNHVFDGIYPPSVDGSKYALERDLVTELWFDDPDHMQMSVGTPYYLTYLKPDEPRFVEDSVVERMIVREEEAKAGQRGPFKLFLFARFTIDQALRDEICAATIARLSTAGAVVKNVPVPGPFGRPFTDVVIEAWFPLIALAAEALDSDLLLAGEGGLDRSRSFAVVAEEFTARRLRARLTA